MGAKVKKKSSLTIKGVYNIEDGKILVDVEDVDDAIDLAAISTEYQGKEVAITITQDTEIA